MKNQSSDVLDAVLEGIDWFKQPQAGDAIVLITVRTEDRRNTAHSKVRTALARNHIRLFGLQLGPIISAYFIPRYGMDFGVTHPGRDFSFNQGSLNTLTEESGGFAFYENTEDSLQSYKLTDQRRQELKRLAGQLYKAVVEYYVI